jgi:hypothetical protein
MTSGLTVATMLTMPFLPGLCAALIRVERAVAADPPASVAAEAT